MQCTEQNEGFEEVLKRPTVSAFRPCKSLIIGMCPETGQCAVCLPLDMCHNVTLAGRARPALVFHCGTVTMKCFECDEPAAHRHHVVPKSKGGQRTVPLCERCHGLVHDANLSINALREEAIARRRAKGLRIGRKPKTITPEQLAQIQGLPITRAAAVLKIRPATLLRRAADFGFQRGPDMRGRRPRRTAPGKGQTKLW